MLTSPLTSNVPVVGVIDSLIKVEIVDFPEPLSPMIPIVSPSWTSKLTFLKAQNSCPLFRFKPNKVFILLLVVSSISNLLVKLVAFTFIFLLSLFIIYF